MRNPLSLRVSPSVSNAALLSDCSQGCFCLDFQTCYGNYLPRIFLEVCPVSISLIFSFIFSKDFWCGSFKPSLLLFVLCLVVWACEARGILASEGLNKPCILGEVLNTFGLPRESSTLLLESLGFVSLPKLGSFQPLCLQISFPAVSVFTPCF